MILLLNLILINAYPTYTLNIVIILSLKDSVIYGENMNLIKISIRLEKHMDERIFPQNI